MSPDTSHSLEPAEQSKSKPLFPRPGDDPLSDLEAAELRLLEQVVESGYKIALRTGQALTAILRRRLYRDTHETFEQYVEDRFGMSRSYAYRLISGWSIALAVSPVGDIENESQARALAGLDEQTAQDVVKAALEAGPLTAARLREARRQVTTSSSPYPDRVIEALKRARRDADRLERLVSEAEKDLSLPEPLPPELATEVESLLERLHGVAERLQRRRR